MTAPTVGNVGNIRDVVGQWKQGAWITVPYSICLGDLDSGATDIVAGTLEWVCPFEEAYVAAVSIANGAAGTATLTLSITNNGDTALLDANADGTGAVVNIAADLSTPAEFEVDDSTIVTTSNAHLISRGESLKFVIASSTGETDGLLVVVTMAVPLQALDESTPGQNFRFD